MKDETTTKGEWKDIKEQLKRRFGKLTEESIESMRDNLDGLSGNLQSVYGYAREQAEKELKNFKASLHQVIEPLVAEPIAKPAPIKK